MEFYLKRGWFGRLTLMIKEPVNSVDSRDMSDYTWLRHRKARLADLPRDWTDIVIQRVED